MDRRILAMIGGIALVISACSSSGGGGSSAAASAAGAPSAAASAAGAACAEASGNGTVAVSVKEFSFEPSTINAKVGDTISFSNTGNAPHNATLDTGGCATPFAHGGYEFDAGAGLYAGWQRDEIHARVFAELPVAPPEAHRLEPAYVGD